MSSELVIPDNTFVTVDKFSLGLFPDFLPISEAYGSSLRTGSGDKSWKTVSTRTAKRIRNKRNSMLWLSRSL